MDNLHLIREQPHQVLGAKSCSEMRFRHNRYPIYEALKGGKVRVGGVWFNRTPCIDTINIVTYRTTSNRTLPSRWRAGQMHVQVWAGSARPQR